MEPLFINLFKLTLNGVLIYTTGFVFGITLNIFTVYSPWNMFVNSPVL